MYFNPLWKSSLIRTLDIGKYVIGLVQTLISEINETEFLISNNQKEIVINLCKKAIKDDELCFPLNGNEICDCENENSKTLENKISNLCNILLNNYRKIRNESVLVRDNKRKLGI